MPEYEEMYSHHAAVDPLLGVSLQVNVLLLVTMLLSTR